MNREKAVAWIVAFLILIASPQFTYFFLGKYVDTENYENREAAEEPVLTIDNFETFPEEYEEYYDDNIPFRNQLIRLSSSIDYYAFHQSSSDYVEIGEDGWLYYCRESDGDPIEQSLGYWTFTEEQLQQIAENLIATEEVLTDRGIEFVLFIAPNKETIYPEYIPDYYSVQSDTTSVDQLVEYLRDNTDIRVVYPKEELLSAKEESDLLFYKKLDTHWGNLGGYIGAAALLKELGVAVPYVFDLDFTETYLSSGDLTNMLNITIKNGDINYDIHGITDLYTIGWAETNIYEGETSGADSRKLFVRRDSYCMAMGSLLESQFNDVMFVKSSSFDQQQIFDYDADIFVYETVERNIKGLLSFQISEESTE